MVGTCCHAEVPSIASTTMLAYLIQRLLLFVPTFLGVTFLGFGIMLMAPGKCQSNERFTLPFSRNDLAELLGLSEETVCRQMASMKRHGVIYAPRGKMQVKDWDQLQGIAEGTLHIH